MKNAKVESSLKNKFHAPNNSCIHIFSTGMATEILPTFLGSEYTEVCVESRSILLNGLHCFKCTVFEYELFELLNSVTRSRYEMLILPCGSKYLKKYVKPYRLYNKTKYYQCAKRQLNKHLNIYRPSLLRMK